MNARRRPHAAGPRPAGGRLHGGARPARRDARGQRHGRRDSPARGGRPPASASGAARADQLRRVRALLPAALQVPAAHRAAARRHGAARPERGHPSAPAIAHRVRHAHQPARAARRRRFLVAAHPRATRPCAATPARCCSAWTSGTRSPWPSGCAASTSPRCSRGRRATASSRSRSPSGWPGICPTLASSTCRTRRCSCPRTSRERLAELIHAFVTEGSPRGGARVVPLHAASGGRLPDPAAAEPRGGGFPRA